MKVIATSVAKRTKHEESAPITVYVPIKSVSLNMASGSVSKDTDANALQLRVSLTAADGSIGKSEETIPENGKCYIKGSAATGKALEDGTFEKPEVEFYPDEKKSKGKLNVTPDGRITAVNGITGKNLPVYAKVTAFNYTKILTCKVTIKDANPLAGVRLSAKKLTVGTGNVAELTAALNPSNPDGTKEALKVRWNELSDADSETPKTSVLGASDYISYRNLLFRFR